MRFTTTHDYPAGLDRLWSAFGRPEYPAAKYAALGATAVRLRRFDAGATLIEVELERDVPVGSAALPVWARPFVGGTQTLHHHSRWQRSAPARVDAELEIVALGLPVRARGRGTIVQTPSGSSRMVLDWEVDATLPGIGGRAARLFAQQVRRSLDEDHRYTVATLGAPAH